MNIPFRVFYKIFLLQRMLKAGIALGKISFKLGGKAESDDALISRKSKAIAEANPYCVGYSFNSKTFIPWYNFIEATPENFGRLLPFFEFCLNLLVKDSPCKIIFLSPESDSHRGVIIFMPHSAVSSNPFSSFRIHRDKQYDWYWGIPMNK